MFLYLVTYFVYSTEEVLTGTVFSIPCNFRNDPPGIVELEYLKEKIRSESELPENTNVTIISLMRITDDRVKNSMAS